MRLRGGNGVNAAAVKAAVRSVITSGCANRCSLAVALAFTAAAMVKKHIAPGGFPFAENAILEGLEGDEYMRRTIEEIQQSTAKMRAKRESSMAHEIAKIRMRQDAVAARRGPPPRPQYPRYEPFSGVRKQPGGAHLDTEYEALLAQLPNMTARNHGWHQVPRLAPPTPGQLARPARSELERLRRQFPNSTQREFGDHWDFRPEKGTAVDTNDAGPFQPGGTRSPATHERQSGGKTDLL